MLLHKKKATTRWYFLWDGISCLLITKKFLFWIFWRWKIWYFWAKKLMEIYLLITEKFLSWSFYRMGNTVFSWAKKLIERWYLLITEKFCFELFGDGKYGLFLSQENNGRIIFTGYWEGLVLSFFLVMGNTVFFSAKKLMERWYVLVNVKFLFWTSRWWEIRPFF